MRGIILEGIPGAGKTRLLDGIKPELPFYHTGPLWLASEHLTERVLEPFAEASPDQAIRHVDSHLRLLSQMDRWEDDAPSGERSRLFYALERFHLSIATHVPGIPESRFDHWEQRLEKLGATLLLLTIPEKQILARAVRGTIRHRGGCWRQYVFTLGETEQQIADHYRREQERLLARFEASPLPKARLDLDPNNIEPGRAFFRNLLATWD